MTFITGLESREKDSTDQQLQHENSRVTGGDRRQHTGLAGLNSTTAAERGMRRVGLSLDLTFPDTRNPDESWFEKWHKDELMR